MDKKEGRRKPGRPLLDVTDFPHADWSQSVEQLQQELGIGQRAAWRLRQEARSLIRLHHPEKFKPARPGRRGYTVADFPGVDWTLPTSALARITGLNRVIVYRLLREAGVDPGSRKQQRQHQFRKVDSQTPTPISKSRQLNTNTNLENPGVNHQNGQRQSR